MEIDKDKVVEAAKAYIAKAEYIIENDIGKPIVTDEYFALKEALNPPPPRPTKEECIKWVTGAFHGGSICDFKGKARATIDYLKEPSLQWVKNTGVIPNAKLVLVKVESGRFDLCSPLDSWLRWGFDDKEKVNYFVEKYIILEGGISCKKIE